jgi:carbamoyltransferase
MYILGLSSFYHDSAVCLIKDGKLVSAVQEERLSRLKHDWRFPERSIDHCLKETGITIDDVGLIVFYEKPFVKFERILETFLSVAPRGILAFLDTVPSWLKKKLWVPHIIQKELGYNGKILFTEHHMAHAAGSFFQSPYDESAILTIDGVGEWATASYGYGKGNTVTLTHEMRFPNSLGLLYSTFTSYLGFKVNDAEYKVMGLAPYGKPEYYDLIAQELVRIEHDGSIRLNMEYFSYQYGKKMFNRKFERLFDIPCREPESPLKEEHFNIAMSVQKIVEDIILKMARHVYKETHCKNICLSGGVSHNCVANGRLLREGPFENIFIQPAAGDAGGAVGAAYLAWHHHLKEGDRHQLTGLFLGPSYSNDEIREFLRKQDVPFKELDPDDLIKQSAQLLAQGRVVGWFQGKMEFGPRALGNRSILADPRRADMRDIVNRKIKFRESFRPFAPSVPEEDAHEYFDISVPSPYMLLTAPVKKNAIPAVTHIDGSARLQTVTRDDNRLYYDLLKEFGTITGIPVLLNTSLNLRSEPIACAPQDAYKVFLRSDMDAIVIENYLLIK